MCQLARPRRRHSSRSHTQPPWPGTGSRARRTTAAAWWWARRSRAGVHGSSSSPASRRPARVASTQVWPSMRRRPAQPACSHRSTRWRTVRSPSRPASRTTAGDSRPSTNASTSSRAAYCSPTNRNAARSRAVASGPASHGSLRADRRAVRTSTTPLTAVRHSGKLLADQPAILGLVRRNETADGRAPGTTCSAFPLGIKLRESCPLPTLPSPVDRSHVGADVRVLAAALVGAPGSQPLAVLAVAGEPALALVEVLGSLDLCAGRASLEFEPRRVTRPDTVLLHLGGPLGLHGPWRSRELRRGRFMRLARGRGGPRMSMALSTGRASTH